MPYAIEFPVAMDQLVQKIPNMDDAVNHICHMNPNFTTWPSFDQEALRHRVRGYLTQMEKVSLTFTLNQLRGTPTFLLFDNDNRVLKNWFGHVGQEEIMAAIQEFQLIYSERT